MARHVFDFFERRDVVSGMWKFSDTIGVEALIALAIELKTSEPERYLDLHVRKCSKDQLGISFQYIFEGDDYKKFFHRITDQLKRLFGNGYVGWDVASPTWMIFDSEEFSDEELIKLADELDASPVTVPESLRDPRRVLEYIDKRMDAESRELTISGLSPRETAVSMTFKDSALELTLSHEWLQGIRIDPTHLTIGRKILILGRSGRNDDHWLADPKSILSFKLKKE